MYITKWKRPIWKGHKLYDFWKGKTMETVKKKKKIRDDQGLGGRGMNEKAEYGGFLR